MIDEAAFRALRRAKAEEVGFALSARTAAVRLVGLVVASTALRVVLGRLVHGPFVFQDELGYERLAWSIAQHGRLALFGKAGVSYSPLYPLVLSPVYVFVHSAPAAYEWAKVVNAALMSAAAFPVYAIGRVVLSRRQSLLAAGLSLVAPLMYYSSLGLSENLAYPLFLVAIWAMLRAVREPRPRNDAVLLVAIMLACGARIQHVALFPAALTAILVVALIAPAAAGERRLRLVGGAFRRHWLLVGTCGAVVVFVLVRTLVQGGSFPLAGRYGNVGTARANPQRVLELAVQHLAGLDLAVGVIPFVGALVAAIALARYGFPRNGLVLGAVAFCATLWVLVEVAVDAAVFSEPPGPDLPRIHERYLIYVVPFFFVALIAALRVPRAKVGLRGYAVVAAIAVSLPAAIPFAKDINPVALIDSPGLQLFVRGIEGRATPVAHVTVFAVVLAALLALAYVYGIVRDRRGLVVAVVACVLVVTSALVGARFRNAAFSVAHRSLPARRNWVDRAVGRAEVALVGGRRPHRLAVWETAFENFSISRVYYTCDLAFGSDFGEQHITVNGQGRLRDDAGVLHTRYAVVPARFHLSGHVLARDRSGGLVLVAPERGMLWLPPAERYLARCTAA